MIKISKEAVFREHGCRFVELSSFFEQNIINQSSVAISEYGNNLRYLKPISGFANHLIWGGNYVHDEYGFNGHSVEDLVEEKLNSLATPLYITGLHFGVDPILGAQKFSFALASKFLEWGGYIQDYLVVSPERRILFLRNEELEYAMYCRDPNLHEQPFDGIEDDSLVLAFHKDRKDFASSAIDGFRIPHLVNEVMPYTLEATVPEDKL